MSNSHEASPLDDILDQISEQLEAAGRVDLEYYSQHYPEYIEQITEAVATMQQLRGLSPCQLADQAPAHLGTIPSTLGDFRIVREIGRGGMAIVYEAEQLSVGRRVAIKVLPFAMLADSRRLSRFQNEVRAVSTLSHPHIIPVFSVGEEHGLHYYAMQLITGQSLARLLETPPLPSPADSPGGLRESGPATAYDLLAGHSSTDQAPLRSPLGQAGSHASQGRRRREYFHAVAQVMAQAADALQHAHEQGIIHRDVKPANLLLSESGTLYVTDFGLALIQNDPRLTRTAELVGTLCYMAPEQALGRSIVDHRADIYGLGATLYELATRSRAFAEADQEDLVQKIAFGQPTRPRRLDPSIPRDLETILLTAMAREPADRYATAADLAEDLRRFQEGRPILAHRPSGPARVAKMAFRHPYITALLLLVIASLSAAAGLGWWSSSQVGRSLRSNRGMLYAADIRLAADAIAAGNVARAAELLERHVPADGEEDLRSFAWYYLYGLIQRADRVVSIKPYGNPTELTWSPAANVVVSAHEQGTVVLWSPQTWHPIRVLDAHAKDVQAIDFSADGHWLVTAGGDNKVIRWAVPSIQAEAVLDLGPEEVTAAAISPDGRLVAVGAGGRILLWEPGQPDPPIPLDHGSRQVKSLSFSPDGQHLASIDDHSLMLWDVANHQGYRAHSDALLPDMRSLALAPDGKWVAVGTQSGQVLIWPLEDMKLIRQNPQVHQLHTSNVYSIEFSSDSRRILTASKDTTICIWEFEGDARPTILHGHKERVYWACFISPSGRVASAGRDQTLRIWPATAAPFYDLYSYVGLQGLEKPRYSPENATAYWNAECLILAQEFGRSTVTCLPVLHGGSYCLVPTKSPDYMMSVGHGVASIEAEMVPELPKIQQSDMDGDGDLDRVAAFGFGRYLVWQERLDRDAWAPPRLADHVPTALRNYYPLPAIVVAKPKDVQLPVRVWPLLQHRWARLFGIARFTGVWAEDIDRDGHSDLLAFWERDHRIGCYRAYTRHGIPSAPKLPDGYELLSDQVRSPVALIPAELDDDGEYDLVAASAEGNRILWLKNLGNLQFSEPMEIDAGWHSRPILDAMDLNGDRRLDVVACSVAGISWYRNLGQGRFGSREILRTLDAKAPWLRNIANDVAVWNTRTGKIVNHFSAHTSWVRCAAASPSGKYLAVGSEDQLVRIWTLPEGKFVRTLAGFSDQILDATWTPDERHILIATGDYVDVWDPWSGRRIQRLSGHGNSVNRLVIAPGGDRLVSLSHDLSVRIWSLKTGHQIKMLLGHDYIPQRAFFLPDGRSLATGDNGGIVRVWDLETGQELLRLSELEGYPIELLGCRPDGSLFALASNPEVIRCGIWPRGARRMPDAAPLPAESEGPTTDKDPRSHHPATHGQRIVRVGGTAAEGVEDAWVYGDPPMRVQAKGTDDKLVTHEDTLSWILVRFATPKLQGTVARATLRMEYRRSWPNQFLAVFRFGRPWNESTVTWNNANNGRDPMDAVVGGPLDAVLSKEVTSDGSGVFAEWDVTDAVRQWAAGAPNHGLLIGIYSVHNGVEFWSREAIPQGYHGPELEIVLDETGGRKPAAGPHTRRSAPSASRQTAKSACPGRLPGVPAGPPPLAVDH